MEEQICEARSRDPELDPQVASRRKKLFEQYIVPHYNMIYKLCMNYSYSKNNVQENYNEVLINFYRRIETYDPHKSILTWIHIVTKRQIAEIERKRSSYANRDDGREVEEFCDLEEKDKAGMGAMDINNYREFYYDDILVLLDSMKDIHRDALLLQQAGYSLKEIADIEYHKGTLLSRNTETIKSRLFFARHYLKQHLTRDGRRKTYQTNDDSIYGDSEKIDRPRF